MNDTIERLGAHVELCISRTYRFGTDAFLLSDFARVQARETACDLCSGCGIVAALWFRTPEKGPKHAFGVEIQPDAVRLMEATVTRNAWQGRLFPICGDLRDSASLGIAAGSCDVLTCNPPYKAAGAGIPSASESALLARHEVACTLADVCACAAQLLRFGGRLCICQRPERLPDAMEQMRAHGLEPKRLRMVQKQPETPPWLVLLEGKKGSKPFMQIDAPLIVEAPGGGFSAELERIYAREVRQNG